MRPHHVRSAATTTTTTTTTTICYTDTYEAVGYQNSADDACALYYNSNFDTQKVTIYYNGNNAKYYEDTSCQTLFSVDYWIIIDFNGVFASYLINSDGNLSAGGNCDCFYTYPADFGDTSQKVCDGTGSEVDTYYNYGNNYYYFNDSCTSLIDGYIGVPSSFALQIDNGALIQQINC